MADSGYQAGNRRLYAGRMSKQYSSKGSWLDDGEHAAVMSVASEVRGGSILDIGVGAGRTAGLLPMLSDKYVAVDYSEALAELARAAYPNLDIRFGDATDLPPDLPGNPFRLVVFSYNGIDTLGHVGRTQVLGQVAKVLEPGGWFVYSTLNRAGPYFDEKPWQRSPDTTRSTPERFARWLAHLGLHPDDYWRRWSSWWRLRNSLEDHGEWAVGPLGGPGSGLVVHWTTPTATRQELATAGLELIAAFEEDGTPIHPLDGQTSAPVFHVVARRPRD
ncbi:MAG: Methylase [Acidimicrobiaceae bacterium]|nr:Methylase [Acidimicrobiaceae bacterium]